MSFVARMLGNLRAAPERVFLQEARDGKLWASPGSDLAARVAHARAGVRRLGLAPGERCALLASNSIAWVAADLALMAEGIVVVPLYGRANPAELAGIVADASPALLLGDDEARLAEVTERLDAPPEVATLEALGAGGPVGADATAEPPDGVADAPVVPRDADDPVTIVYTSGTSGEPKGVILTRAGIEFILEATNARLDRLMRGRLGDEKVFHYLPFCFAGSWILLLLCLSRRATLTLNTDVTRIVDDLGMAPPHYFQNVPVLLERMRAGIEQALDRRAGPIGWIWTGARRALGALADGERAGFADSVRLTLARLFLFPTVRKRIGPRLRALICGSAPLAPATQHFFEAIGVPVLQVYGLTETTAICTMDEPGGAVPGRVGKAVDGVELRVGDDGEILVRGPNVFAGYWNRPEASAAAFEDGWFRTGDLGDVDADGRWRIEGRAGNVLVPASGHNVAPEPMEERLAEHLPDAAQVVVVGDGRPHLAVLVAGSVEAADVEAAVGALNASQPHYRKIRASLVLPDPFTIESGLLTANGKLKRRAIATRFADEIDALYARAGETVS